MSDKIVEVALYPHAKPRKRLKAKRKRIKRGLHRFKRTEADLKREWLVPTNAWMRYKGLRGIYWYWLSIDVRKMEWVQWGGRCLTCLEFIPTWQEGQCGHIVSSSYCGEYLRLNRINLTIQHAACNNPKFSPHAGVANAVNIDKRHGAGYMEMLLSLRKTECKEPGQEEYRVLIRAVPSYQEAVDNSTTTC